MKKILSLLTVTLLLSKVYAQQASEDSTFVPSSFFTVTSVTEMISITDRRLIGVKEVYMIQDGVIMQHGFTVDPERGILYAPFHINSTTTVIYKR